MNFGIFNIEKIFHNENESLYHNPLIVGMSNNSFEMNHIIFDELI